MSIYQDTPPDPNASAQSRSARPNPIATLIIIIVFGAVFYSVSQLNARPVTDTFEEFSITHPAFWSKRDASQLYQCDSGAIGGCVADYLLTGQAASAEIVILRVFSFTGGNGLDNPSVQGGIDAMLRGMNAQVTSRENLTLAGLPAERIEFSSDSGQALVFVAKPSLYIHLFFAFAENQTQLTQARADIEAFIQGVTFTTE